MGADDGLSASELRQRYHAGGSASDAELSAAQLRSRYGIESNKKGAPDRNASSSRPGAAPPRETPAPSAPATPRPAATRLTPQTSARAKAAAAPP